MAKMLRDSAKSWGFGCGRAACCEGKNGHQAIQQLARRREDRSWRTEWDDYQTADDVAYEFNMDNAIAILFGDVDPK